MGACTLIEKALEKELVWIACHHHVFEVMLTSVSSVGLGLTCEPQVGVFKRVQNTWSFINKADFRPASDELDFRFRSKMDVYFCFYSFLFS